MVRGERRQVCRRLLGEGFCGIVVLEGSILLEGRVYDKRFLRPSEQGLRARLNGEWVGGMVVYLRIYYWLEFDWISACAGTTRGGVFGFGEDDWLGCCLWYALSIRFAANLVVIGGWLSVGGLVVLGSEIDIEFYFACFGIDGCYSEFYECAECGLLFGLFFTWRPA